MTAPTGNQLAVGAREGFFFALNANGYPDAQSTAVYEGLPIVGLKAADLNVPNPRVIPHSGNDRNLANDFLPSLEPITGEIRAANLGMDLNSTLMATKTYDVGSATFMGWGTSQQGSEIDAALLIFQQSLDTAAKTRNYRTIIAPKVRAVPLPSGMNENANEQRFQIVSNPASKHLWGEAFTNATEGFTEAAFEEGMVLYKPKVVAWKGDGSTVDFLFPTDRPAADITRVAVWNNGTPVAGGDMTIITTKITFDTAPVTGHIIVAFYEYA